MDMNTVGESVTYVKENIKDFHTDHIFDCGQCFRFERQDDGSYIGPAMGKVIRVAFEDGRLTIDNANEEEFRQIWSKYLDLERDYSELKKLLTASDEIMKTASEYGYGIRILNQDFWETVVSFIISQNNNIPRIKGCIESLCSNFGAVIGEYGGRVYYDMPTPEKLASLTVEDLSPCRLGYRAQYLIKMAQQFMEKGGPEEVRKEMVGAPDPIEALQDFCGIGPKVAACISLFGLGRFDAFPIDVWMRRVMNRLYGIDEKDIKAMKAYAQDHFGEYGGIAQQYLFYYIRSLDT